MNFSDVCILQDGIEALQSDPNVRHLLASVAQNPQTEEVDLALSRTSVMKIPLETPAKLALFKLRSFLQKVYYAHMACVKDNNDLFYAFLYENHTRLQKMLIVAKILDYANLASFGTEENPVLPQISDIPTYARLWNVILEFVNRPSEPTYRLDSKAACTRINNRHLKKMPKDFLFCCPEEDYEGFKARGTAELDMMSE